MSVGDALIGVGGVLVGGFITYGVTARTVKATTSEGAAQRDQDAAQRELDRSHELQLAREEREQARKADAYLKIVTYVSRSIEWARTIVNALNEGDYSKIPKVPSAEEGIIASAAGQLYLSAKAAELLNAYDEAKDRFGQAIHPGNGSSMGKIALDANEWFDAMTARSDIVLSQLRSELSLPQSRTLK
jgi:hypothetical protein